jgi:hypothetical protein
MKDNKNKLAVRIMCWILAGLMVAGAATILISAIIEMIAH